MHDCRRNEIKFICILLNSGNSAAATRSMQQQKAGFAAKYRELIDNHNFRLA